MRRLVVGDIHGNLDALKSALNEAGYDSAKDHLYFVGDYIDRHPNSAQVVAYILTLPHTTCILGNHDQLMIDFLEQEGSERIISSVWEDNGGLDTLKSYGITINRSGHGRTKALGDVPPEHVDFLQSLHPWHMTSDNIAIVHGGFELSLQDMSAEYVIWDRLMWQTAKEDHAQGESDHACFNRYKSIFIGHTNLLDFNGQQECLPQKRLNVWNIDTGAGFAGPLTIMDMDTEEFWQSSV